MIQENPAFVCIHDFINFSRSCMVSLRITRSISPAAEFHCISFAFPGTGTIKNTLRQVFVDFLENICYNKKTAYAHAICAEESCIFGCFQTKRIQDNRPWRSWISQWIPIPKAGGSNPSGRASRLSLHAHHAPHCLGCVLFCARV